MIELLVVVSVIALLIGLLLPALAQSRQAALHTKCLANMRSLEQAHWAYATANNGYMIRVGLAHGGAHASPLSWFYTLQEYYGTTLLLRSPVDNSPHWGPYPAGQPIPGAPPTQRRQTSYGVNNFLDPETCPWGGPYARVDQVPRPGSTIHFLIMAFEGEFAGADHPHVESWTPPDPPARAATQVQIHAHGGPPRSWQSLSNWGYLDGHAEIRRFHDVFTDFQTNRFDPHAAR